MAQALKRLFAAAFVAGIAGEARAHPLDLGYLRIDTTGERVSVALDLEASVAAHAIGLKDITTASTAAARAKELAAATYEKTPLATNAGACTWRSAGASLVNRTVNITGEADCPPDASSIRWELPFLAAQAPTFQLLVKAHDFDGDHHAFADPKSAVVELPELRFRITFRDRVREGAANMVPPKRIDPLLVLLALALGGGTIAELALIGATFAIGSAIGSALGLHLPEPVALIAVFVAAAQAWTGRGSKYRAAIALAGGALHGGEPSVGYDVGVAIIAIGATLAGSLFSGKPKLRRGVAAGIVLCGLAWFALKN